MDIQAITSTEKGKIGESYVFEMLQNNGIHVTWLPVGENADFKLPDGRLIEVKFSSLRQPTGQRKCGFWSFNLHHHGKKQQEISFFICVAKGQEHDMLFVMPGYMLKSKTWVLTEEQVERGAHDYFQNNFALIKDAA